MTVNYMDICMSAALAGGDAVRLSEADRAFVKEDHHSIYSSADNMSQKKIFEVINENDPDAYAITEEKCKDKSFKERIIGEESLKLLKTRKAYLIDPLDGSSSKAAGHYEWSVSVAHLDRMRHDAGAVYAPEILGGVLFYAALNKGAFMESSYKKAKRIEVNNRQIKNAYVLLGIDCLNERYTVHNQASVKIANLARTANTINSCALGLCMVAAGKSDALIQPPQYPWDWSAGKPILEEAGGLMIFYEMNNNGVINVIENLELRHYNPNKRGVGFIAGNEKLANELLGILMS